MTTHSNDLDYLDHLARESARFLEAIGDAPPSARVPSCPDWDADDLLWHLAEVQWFWGTIVREQVTGSRAEELKPDRPADRAALTEFYRRATSALSSILAARPPDTPAWTWSDDHSVGFIRRRQAHEALIHRLDAELTAGNRTSMHQQLSADGVDEALRIMYGGLPPWGRFTSDNTKTVRLLATDTGDSWFVTLGRFTGTDPDDNTTYDEPDLHADDTDPGTDASATIRGTAADLDCWLWHRPAVEPVDTSGDQAVLDDLDKLMGPGIN